MKRIGILPVDSKYPNYALMKVSTWWRGQGAQTAFYSPFGHFDKVYISKIFTFTPDYLQIISNADEVYKGGTGYDLTSKLPKEIDDCEPDYDLYNLPTDFSLGFLTRGCRNTCPWCVVPKKEGAITPYRDIVEITQGTRNKVTLMDNNILACDYGMTQLEKIAEIGCAVDFNQGMEARLIDVETARLLASIKWLKYIRLACDTHSAIEPLRTALRRLRESGYKGEIFVYCLITSDLMETLTRINEIAAMDNLLQPFAQPYRDFHNNTPPPKWQQDMARWVNCKKLLRSTSFAEYSPRKGFKCETYLKTNN